MSSATNYANREWGWNLDNPTPGLPAERARRNGALANRAEAAGLLRAASREEQAAHLVPFITLALHTGIEREKFSAWSGHG